MAGIIIVCSIFLLYASCGGGAPSYTPTRHTQRKEDEEEVNKWTRKDKLLVGSIAAFYGMCALAYIVAILFGE